MRCSFLRTSLLPSVLSFVFALANQYACATDADEPGEKAAPAEEMAAPYRFDDDIPGECRRLSTISYPRSDQPTALQAQGLQGCEAYQHYYGIGRPRDYAKARQCAFSQPSPESGVAGEWILMMLYANGQGVSRNLELAKKAACNSGLSDDDLESSIVALRQRQVEAGRTTPKLDFCHVTVSPRSHDLCHWMRAQAEIQKYESQLAPKQRTWTRLQRSAFDEMQKKWTVYINFHADFEDRRVGSDAVIHRRAVWVRQKARFLELLRDFEKGDYPSYNAEDYRSLDAILNEEWKRRIRPELLADHESVDGIRRTQRAWLAYREAWVKFAAYRYGGVSPEAWRAHVTVERLAQLCWIEAACSQ